MAAIEADVHFERFRAAEALEFALLQDAQQLHLHGGGHVADFVEEERAFVGQLEFSGLARSGAGEGALFVAEKLAFEQDFREWRCC